MSGHSRQRYEAFLEGIGAALRQLPTEHLRAMLEDESRAAEFFVAHAQLELEHRERSERFIGEVVRMERWRR